MECKKCHCVDFEIVWGSALVEEGMPVHMYQCENCKRVVMASDDWEESTNKV